MWRIGTCVSHKALSLEVLGIICITVSRYLMQKDSAVSSKRVGDLSTNSKNHKQLQCLFWILGAGEAAKASGESQELVVLAPVPPGGNVCTDDHSATWRTRHSNLSRATALLVFHSIAYEPALTVMTSAQAESNLSKSWQEPHSSKEELHDSDTVFPDI